MSKNKMGGVPSQTRDALYRFFEKMRDSDDQTWSEVISKMTELGAKKSLERLNK
jgi:hypothetical protein